MFSIVFIDDSEIRNLIRNDRSKDSLWVYLEMKAAKAVLGAKNAAGGETGALKRSIGRTHRATSYGQEVTIYANNKIAYIHHEGSRPHLIVDKPGEVLHFRVGSRVVHTRFVRHPGTKGNPFLSSQLIHFRG